MRLLSFLVLSVLFTSPLISADAPVWVTPCGGRSLAISHDGTLIASAGLNSTSLIDVATGRVLWTITGTKPAFTSVGNRLLLQTDIYTHVFDPSTGSTIASNRNKDKFFNYQVSVDGRRVLVRLPMEILVWDVASGDTLIRTPQPGDVASQLSSDGELVIISSGNAALHQPVTLIDVHGTLPDRKIGALEIAACLTPTGDTLVTCSADGKVRLWDVSTGTMIGEGGEQWWQNVGEYGVPNMVVTPDGTRLIATLANPAVFDLHSRTWTRTFESSTFSVDGNGRELVVVDPQNRVTIHDLLEGTSVVVAVEPERVVTNIAYDPTRAAIAYATSHGTIELEDRITQRHRWTIDRVGVTMVEDGVRNDRVFVNVSSSGFIDRSGMLDRSSGAIKDTFRGRTEHVLSTSQILVNTGDSVVHYDLNTRADTRAVPSCADPSVIAAKDGHWAVYCRSEATLLLYSLWHTGPRWSWTESLDHIARIEISEAAGLVVCRSDYDTLITVRSLSDGAVIQRILRPRTPGATDVILRDHPPHILDIRNQTPYWIDAESGNIVDSGSPVPILAFPRPLFSADGARMYYHAFSGGRDSRIQTWDLSARRSVSSVIVKGVRTWSRSGSVIAVLEDYDEVVFVDTERDSTIGRQSVDPWTRHVQYDHRSNTLLVSSADQIALWDLNGVVTSLSENTAVEPHSVHRVTMAVYPHPLSSSSQITVTFADAGSQTLTIVDATGRVIHRRAGNGTLAPQSFPMAGVVLQEGLVGIVASSTTGSRCMPAVIAPK